MKPNPTEGTPQEGFRSLLVRMQTAQPLQKAALSRHLSYGPAETLLSLYLTELKTDIPTKTSPPWFTTALIIIDKTRKQKRCSAAGE